MRKVISFIPIIYRSIVTVESLESSWDPNKIMKFYILPECNMQTEDVFC